MTLRAKTILYLVLIHLVFAAIAVFVLLKNRVWLLAVEAVLLVSVLAGIKLLSNLFGPRDSSAREHSSSRRLIRHAVSRGGPARNG